MTLTKGDPCDHLSLEGRNPRKCSLFKMFFGFMYKLYRHKLYRHNLYRHKLYRHKLYREQIVSGTNCIGTNCIGNKLYRHKFYRHNLYRHNLYRTQIVSGTNCIGHNLRGQKSLGPLKTSLETAQKVIVPQKKIMSRSFLNSGTLIVIPVYKPFFTNEICFKGNNTVYVH